MSIHNFVDVHEEEVHEAKAFTRDRLGKKHLLVDEHGDLRIANLRKKAVAASLFLFLMAGTSTGWAKGPNTTVSSNDPEVASIERWMNQSDPKPSFYQDDSTSVGFNDNGDPSVSTRF